MNVDEKNNKDRLPFEHYKGLYEKMDPEEAAARCRVPYDPETHEFTITLMNKKYKVSHPDYVITPVEDDGTYHALTSYNPAEILILRYLLEGVNKDCTGEKKAYADMPWGEVYLQQFSGRCLARLAYGFGYKLDKFAEAMEKMGAEKVDMGDVAYKLEFLNNLYLYFILWGPDDEFPPSSQILFSDNFECAFKAEDMAVVGDISIGAMKQVSQ
ncbi:MAG: DUF3786 domain-containing protein [Lachnospiraceae bacterium]|jgi:hypothetical protein|nr:DUF3786 domain-containing protein [Lachnospiraceae bacterium]